jgi:D-beta-D-heptose 7-phosphate kinase/D-beta-D-heptose 1-phosphate adenosyltransferase
MDPSFAVISQAGKQVADHLMPLPPLGADRARELVSRFSGVPVLVAGDVMLDRFIVGSVTRISPEAPVPVVRFRSEHIRLGGAANVAHNIAALGGKPTLAGLIGIDAAGARLREQLSAVGIRGEGLVEDRDRRTTEKVRVVTERNQQVARIDYEADGDAHGHVKQALLGRVKSLGRDMQVLLVSDYLKGTVSRALIEALVAIKAASRVPLIVDPKIPHLDCYGGATLVTPNHHEAEAATHRLIRTDDEARTAARDIRARVRCDAVLITRGEHGMWLSDQEVEGSVQAVAREVSDVTGAGDTVAATLALALAVVATHAESAKLANHAAGIVVGRFGAATVTPQELLDSIKSEV